MGSRKFHTILHATDLHVNEPTGTSEHLRENYYEEYIGQLADMMRKSYRWNIDTMLLTGDFVDRGKVQHFDHVQKVVNHLGSRLSCPIESIMVCPGNHDIVRPLELAGKFDEARARYREFAKAYAQGEPIDGRTDATLFELKPRIWCLMIDATHGSAMSDAPCDVDDSMTDQLVASVRRVPKKDILVIMSHYPVHPITGDLSFVDNGEPDYYKRHIWTAASALKYRIERHRSEALTLWLAGDIHIPSHFQNGGSHFVVTGRLGTRTTPPDSPVRRQVRLIRIGIEKAKVESHIAYFDQRTHQGQSHIGQWKIERGEILATNVQGRKHNIAQMAQVSSKKRRRTVRRKVHLSLPHASVAHGKLSTAPLTLIDEALQNEILRTVKEERLYHFGRFHTSNDQVSLAWVYIGPLMSEGTLLASTVVRMSTWLKDYLEGKNRESEQRALLLGVGCWGAVFASQISMQIGVRNLCIAARARGVFNVAFEVIDDDVISAIKASEIVVLITDVVTTGASLRFIYEEVSRHASTAVAGSKTWIVLSVICDAKNDRTVDCGFLETHATCCLALRMPVLPKESFPDQAILPPTISF